MGASRGHRRRREETVGRQRFRDHCLHGGIVRGIAGDLLVFLHPGGGPTGGLAAVDKALPIHHPDKPVDLAGVQNVRDADNQGLSLVPSYMSGARLS